MSHWAVVSSSTISVFVPVHKVTDGSGFGVGVDFILALDDGWFLDAEPPLSLDTLGGSP